VSLPEWNTGDSADGWACRCDTQAGKKLTDAEGLGQEVFRTGIEQGYLASVGTTDREHDHGHTAPLA
jgi:hypothetical protein